MEEYEMKKSRGFTLIEVMIVVVIIGILVAIAWPSYQRQLAKGRRASAQTFMADVANKQQQYILDARTYAPDFATLPNTTPPADLANFYTFAMVAAGPPPSFTITATAIGPQAAGTWVDNCGENLRLDSTGAKARGTCPGW
jgi:type IV pilus assembly protein PilE